MDFYSYTDKEIERAPGCTSLESFRFALLLLYLVLPSHISFGQLGVAKGQYFYCEAVLPLTL
jgi:hypothetical protein